MRKLLFIPIMLIGFIYSCNQPADKTNNAEKEKQDSLINLKAKMDSINLANEKLKSKLDSISNKGKFNKGSIQSENDISKMRIQIDQEIKTIDNINALVKYKDEELANRAQELKNTLSLTNLSKDEKEKLKIQLDQLNTDVENYKKEFEKLKSYGEDNVSLSKPKNQNDQTSNIKSLLENFSYYLNSRRKYNQYFAAYIYQPFADAGMQNVFEVNGLLNEIAYNERSQKILFSYLKEKKINEDNLRYWLTDLGMDYSDAKDLSEYIMKNY